MTLRRSVAFLVALTAFAWVVSGGAASTGKTGSAGSGGLGSACIAHHPNYVEDVFEPLYVAGCTGHDEPELDPVSSAPHSAKNLTWRFVLPSNGAYPVDAVGPTFWFGGTVTDPNSLFGQAFLEVQFYPNALVRNCTPNGGFVVSYAPNTYTVCSPVWSIHTTGQKPVYHEPAAFNAMLTTGARHQPLVMHAGDTIDLHFHVVSTHEGWHIDVLDETTGQSGTIVLNSADGPLLPAYDKQEIGNALGWGLVYDTPNSFVWEIGHTSPFTSPASQFCIPGQPNCQSFNAPAWAGTSPIQIKSVTFGDGSQPTQWATSQPPAARPRCSATLGRPDPLHGVRRTLLHLSVVHARIERLPLRRGLCGRGRRPWRRRPVRPDARLWRAVRRQQHVLRHSRLPVTR